jgi:hypothetical protein
MVNGARVPEKIDFQNCYKMQKMTHFFVITDLKWVEIYSDSINI